MSEPRAANGGGAREAHRSDRDRTPVLLNERQWLYVQKRYELTPRELQVAALVCRGLRNGSIARSLRIQPGTVKTHVKNIYRKVRVRSKIAMLLRFVEEVRKHSGGWPSVPSG
jgi:DNA-binding NarL/FixJ family response regulator